MVIIMTDTADIKALREGLVELLDHVDSYGGKCWLFPEDVRSIISSLDQLEAERQRADYLQRINGIQETTIEVFRHKELAELKGDQVPVSRAVNGDMMKKPINLTDHPILQQAFGVIQAIEKCGASIELTNAVTEAGKLMTAINELVKSDETPFIFAICHPDGYALMDDGCVALDQNHLGVVLADLRKETGEDYRMVPLFTAPQKPVVLPSLTIGEVMHRSGYDRQYAEGWVSANDNAIREIKAAGGIVKDGE